MLVIDFPILKLDFDYQPESIEYAHEMDLINAMYSRIFYYNDSGFIKTDVLDNFHWKDGLFTISFKKNLKTSKGNYWGAEDAFLSIKRLLVLDKNTHGKLKSFLCPEDKVKRLEDHCKGLELVENKVLFNIKKGQVKILMELMTTGEMGIIPKSLINRGNLKITDHSETTGHYYLDKINKDEQSATLKANKFHSFQNTKENKIKLLGHYNYSAKPEDYFQESKVQVMPTFSFVDHGTAFNKGKNKDYNIHTSLPISLHYIRFSPNSEVPKQRRLSVLKKIKTLYLNKLFIKNFHIDTYQLFSDLGELSLDPKYLTSFKQAVQTSSDMEDGEGITMGVSSKASLERYRELFKEALPKLKFRIKKSFFFSPEDNIDFLISTSDTGMHEHYSLIAYFSSSKTFQFKSKKQEEKWFETYANEENKEVRLRMAKEKHFESLMNGYALPIYLSPYVALAKKPWKLDLPKIYAGTPLWRIYRE